MLDEMKHQQWLSSNLNFKNFPAESNSPKPPETCAVSNFINEEEGFEAGQTSDNRGPQTKGRRQWGPVRPGRQPSQLTTGYLNRARVNYLTQLESPGQTPGAALPNARGINQAKLT